MKNRKTDETEFQRTLTNQYEALNNLRGETQNID